MVKHSHGKEHLILAEGVREGFLGEVTFKLLASDLQELLGLEEWFSTWPLLTHHHTVFCVDFSCEL